MIDWGRYFVIHIVVINTIWSIFGVIFRLPFYKQYSENNNKNKIKNDILRILTMIVMIAMTLLVFHQVCLFVLTRTGSSGKRINGPY